MAPHAILHETGVDFLLIEAQSSFLKSDEYRAINPNGTVPTLVCPTGDYIYESAAICQYLVEKFPDTGLNPEINDPVRGQYLQWIMHLTNTVQEAMTIWWHPEQYTSEKSVQLKIRLEAEEKLDRLWQVIDDHLKRNGPFLCGERFFACDYYLAMLVRWTREMKKPGEQFTNINRLIQLTLERPAYQKMLQDQQITQNVL